MRSYFRCCTYLFILFWPLVVFPQLHIIRFFQEWTSELFYGLVKLVFGEQNFQSDGGGVYFSLLVVLSLSILLAVPLRNRAESLRTLGYRSTVFWLVLILMVYGWMKVTGEQFYLPDPNILDARFGDLSRDTVYWSLNGASPGYEFFLGSIEMLAAVLLLFRRCRPTGIMLAIGIFVQVFAVNLFFDISVKLLSGSMLLLCMYLLLFHLESISALFMSVWKGFETPAPTNSWLWSAAVALLLTETFSGWIMDSGSPDSHAGRYRYRNSEETFYVHRMGYVITRESDKFQSNRILSSNTQSTVFQHLNHSDSIDWITQRVFCSTHPERGKFLPFRKHEELLESGFHLTSDSFH